MNRLRIHFLALALGAALASMPATALAINTSVYWLGGVELAATPNSGTFAGIAFARDDSGAWNAIVNHELLPTTIDGTALITGGTFALDGSRRDLGGVDRLGVDHPPLSDRFDLRQADLRCRRPPPARHRWRCGLQHDADPLPDRGLPAVPDGLRHGQGSRHLQPAIGSGPVVLRDLFNPIGLWIARRRGDAGVTNSLRSGQGRSGTSFQGKWPAPSITASCAIPFV